MNYETATDFEINEAVVRWVTGCHLTNGQSVYISESPLMGERIPFDPCNNWADAGPIIEENKILTAWAFTANGECTWVARITNQGQAGPYRFEESFHANPLRAAMIVFLKMQEAK